MTRFAGVALTLLAVGCAKPPEVYVDCVGTGHGYDLVCTLTHRAGDRGGHACWTASITCVNGTVLAASACGDVQPTAKASTLMPGSAFGNTKACDAAKSMALSDAKTTAL